MASTKGKTAANALLFAGLVAGALVLVNIFSARFYHQVDMTKYKIYSLSSSSKALVSHLDEKLVVTVYESSNLPQQFTPYTQYLDDLLNEYQAASHGSVEWRKLDPSKDDSLATEAKEASFITQVPEKDQIRELKGWLGVRFIYKGKTEWYKAADERSGQISSDPSELEYQLTTTMRKLVVDKKPKIGLLTGHGELGQGRGEMSILFNSKELTQNYDTTTIDLKGGSAPIADDVDMLFVVGPKQKLTDREQYELDQLAMKGKPIAFFLDGVTTQAPRTSGDFDASNAMPQIGHANDTGLDGLLAAYGFRVNHDVLLDKRVTYGPAEIPFKGNQDIAVSTAFMVAPVRANGQGDFAQGVSAAVFPLAASIDRVGPLGDLQQPAGSSLTLVAETSGDAMKAKEDPFFMFDPLHNPEGQPDPATKGRYPLAWLYRGPLKSAWAGKPAPAMNGDTALTSALDPNAKTESPSGAIAVFGSSSFLSDSYLMFAQLPAAQAYRGNLVLFLDLIDWGVKDQSLSQLRAKGNVTWPLQVEDGSKQPLYFRVANLAGLPLLVILLGIGRATMRRRRRDDLNQAGGAKSAGASPL